MTQKEDRSLAISWAVTFFFLGALVALGNLMRYTWGADTKSRAIREDIFWFDMSERAPPASAQIPSLQAHCDRVLTTVVRRFFVTS